MSQTTSLGVERLFTPKKSKAYDQLKWVKRDSIIKNPMTGKAVFEQKGVEFPDSWSLNAINIVAQKYFTGTPGTRGREKSLKASGGPRGRHHRPPGSAGRLFRGRGRGR